MKPSKQQTYCRMAGDFERDRPAVESHNFRNPLDEVENMTRSTYSYSAHNTSNTNNHNGLSSRRSQEVPVGNLLDGFEIIDNFESCSRERTLIDVDEPPTKPHRRSENDLLVTLVTKRTIGLQFDKRNGQFSEGREIEICPGTLVREMADDDWKTPKLKDWVENRKLRQEGLAVPMEASNFGSGTHLLSVNPSERLELFCEVERFNYIFNLKIGDPVLVDQ
uniref:Uncharacterized protein n=2 Tax=Caenorhabditis japonica TaxID=281687 RepID=A0A8R1INY4_CAEJA